MSKSTFFFDARDPEKCWQHIQPLFEAIEKEESLPCVLLCAAYIDSCLKGLLEKQFTQGGSIATEILDSKGFLGASYNRARLAYCLGLIDKPTFQNIDFIGQIRNLFAHSPAPVDFDDTEITDLCNKLKPVQVTLPPYLFGSVLKVIFSQSDNKNTPKQQFITNALKTALIMIAAPEKIEAAKKTSDTTKPQPDGK